MDYEEKHWILVEMGVTLPQKEHVSEAPKQQSKQQRFDFTETIVICAGEEQEEYLVHTNVLTTSSSKFLNRMLSNDWRETRDKRLSLPETRPEVLEVYLHWMYTSNIILGPEPADTSTERRVELYLLGDYLDDMAFCEAIVDGLVELSCGSEHKLPSAPAVGLAWSKTIVDNPLRAVIKELFLGVPIKFTVEALSNNDKFPYEFIVDLVSALAENDKNYCERSISHKSDAQIREACKGFVRSANQERFSTSASVRLAAANAKHNGADHTDRDQPDRDNIGHHNTGRHKSYCRKVHLLKLAGVKESRQMDKGAAVSESATTKPYLSDTFTICTDDPQRPIEFSIYGYIITLSTSSVLKSLFDDPSARAKGIVLHHTRADTLSGYVHWLRTRQFLSKRPEGFKGYIELIDFFLLGEVLQDQVFCQQAVDAIIAIRYDGRKWPDYHVTNEIWERTSPDSPLRKVMKELWLSTNADKAMRCLKTAPEPGYHRDVILSLLEELISRGVFVKEATFSGRSRREVEEACRKFVQGMKVEQVK